MFGGPDRTDDLFHAISATSRNSLKLHDTNRAYHANKRRYFPCDWTLNGPLGIRFESALSASPIQVEKLDFERSAWPVPSESEKRGAKHHTGSCYSSLDSD